MRLIQIFQPLARLLGASLLLTPAFSGSLISAHANGRAAVVAQTIPFRLLTPADFFDSQLPNGSDAFRTDTTMYGQTYKYSISLYSDGDKTSFDARNFPTYNAISFGIGANGSDDLDDASRVEVLGDGHLLASIQPTSAAVHVYGNGTILLTGHHIITIERKSDKDGWWSIIDPALGKVGAPPPAAPTITLASLSSQSGSQQTVDVTTQAGRQVTIVIVYANGAHQIFGPQHAGPTGHDIYTFTVPQDVTGTAEVVAIVTGLGVARTSFMVP